jgi:hypothetical protein
MFYCLVTCEVEVRKFDGRKLSKDHLDSVLTVDANNELQLFCSCRYDCINVFTMVLVQMNSSTRFLLTSFSKDGSIKIWNHSKVLLREIIMDRTLTAVCFLNASGR